MSEQSEYKVLIPLDGSRMAEHALAFLPALSHLGRLEVTLVSVTDIPEDMAELVQSPAVEREYNLLETYQREIAADLEEHLAATVHLETPRGPAATRILEAAAEASPDLIVISTHGRSGIARFTRGAVADKVIRGASSSVLVVGPRVMEQAQWLDADLVPPFKRILVPLDGSDTAETALPLASEYARTFGSELHLLQVMPYVPISSGFWDTPATLREDILSAGSAYLAGVAGRITGVDGVQTGVSIGSAASEIDVYIQAKEIDLVVMTSSGRGGLARAALGSVTDRVIGLGPPVLVVRGE